MGERVGGWVGAKGLPGGSGLACSSEGLQAVHMCWDGVCLPACLLSACLSACLPGLLREPAAGTAYSNRARTPPACAVQVDASSANLLAYAQAFASRAARHPANGANGSGSGVQWDPPPTSSALAQVAAAAAAGSMWGMKPSSASMAAAQLWSLQGPGDGSAPPRLQATGGPAVLLYACSLETALP